MCYANSHSRSSIHFVIIEILVPQLTIERKIRDHLEVGSSDVVLGGGGEMFRGHFSDQGRDPSHNHDSQLGIALGSDS